MEMAISYRERRLMAETYLQFLWCRWSFFALPLDTFQDCKVSDRWVFVDGRWKGMWSWRIPPRGRALDDLASLISHIGNFSLSDGVDKWVWKDDVSGIFK
ncbi:hypothetical protein Tco_1178060, partial [Tanacetum coccineum]